MAQFRGYYPGGFYMPDPWQTTWVSRHFPEHHYPLEHARHSISRALGDFAHDLTHAGPSEYHLISPRSDIRESTTTFYIDVELPGIATEEQMTLNWLGSRTLLLRATVTRAPTPEDDTAVKQSDKDATMSIKDETKDHDKKQGDQSVYLTLGERHLGTFGRAFNFPVDVDHDGVTAKLAAGVLRLTVPKLPEGSKFEKKVNVQTVESH